MKLNVRVQMTLNREAGEQIRRAVEAGLRDTVVAITRQTKQSPPVGSPRLTGNNARSIDFDVKGLTGRVFSTSGYGGFLEVGTARMPARPYFKPALDMNIGNLPRNIERHMGAFGG